MNKLTTQNTAESTPDLSEEQTSYLNLISSSQLRTLGNINQEIIVSINNNYDVQSIEESILKDASLTAHILKTASSVVYTTSDHQNVVSIRDAIVRIGFEGIRSICITVALIDSIPKRHATNKYNLLKCISKSFHNAIQSKNVALKMKGCQEDEAYVGGLLQNIGELAFWCSPLHNMEGYINLAKSGLEPEECCKILCGRSFKELSATLSREWNLGELLFESLQNTPKTVNAIAVKLGTDITNAIESGWDSVEMDEVNAKLIQEFKTDINSNNLLLHKGFRDALSEVVNYFPDAEKILQKSAPTISSKDPAIISVKSRSRRKADKNIQIEAMDKIMELASAKVDRETYFKILADSIYNGVALERVAIVAINGGGGKLKATHLVGKKIKKWVNDFTLSIGRKDTFLRNCLDSSKSIFVSQKDSPKLYSSVDKSLKSAIGNSDSFLISPIMKAGKPIALVYADMAEEEWEISDAQYKAFSRLVRHVSNALTVSQN